MKKIKFVQKSAAKLLLNLKLISLIVFGFVLRISFIKWDSGFHFHPDERMLIMVADKIHFWSDLNPDFFNYGSLPIYILKGTSQFLDFAFHTHLATYDGMLLVGRLLSTVADLSVIVLIYHIAYILFRSKKISIWSAFFYCIAFFPIQNSHFFIVDTFLSLFATVLIYLLLLYLENPSIKKLILISIVFSAALTTKISAIIFIPVIFLIFLFPSEQSKNVARYALHVTRILAVFIFALCTLTFAFIFMPYAFIEHARFLNDVLQQTKMNSDPYVFPYTLQYVGTMPYIYYLKNIFIWGLGPMIGIFTIVGIITNMLNFKFKISNFKIINIFTLRVTRYTLYLLFYLLYFAVIGHSAVKFMRYMLLMYPFFAIMAGYGFHQISNLKFQISKKRVLISYFLIFISFLWTTMFLNIYTTPNTRIQATEWINKYIPANSTLAVEHWDDRVPIFDSEKYNYEELPLYDIPDDDLKWQGINDKLSRSDYIVIASNRLYAPLQRLDNCQETYPRCYPITSEYYKDLLSGKLNYFKVAEFTSYPRFQISNFKFQISDLGADESFTVYDHPRILIFKKK